MAILAQHQKDISEFGFTIIDKVYSDAEIEFIIHTIHQGDSFKPSFRKTTNLFAVRQFLKEIPGTVPLIFTEKLCTIINGIFGSGYFVVKSIYFDKPAESNWFVPYHQDLTISVDKKLELPGFGPWTVKQDQYAVQPPLEILENNFTIRIHLDDTNENNGALRVIPGSHVNGIYRPGNIDLKTKTEVVCDIKRGGIMIMRPLLLHASSRSIDQRKRRVVHIELTNCGLPAPLQWSELLTGCC